MMVERAPPPGVEVGEQKTLKNRGCDSAGPKAAQACRRRTTGLELSSSHARVLRDQVGGPALPRRTRKTVQGLPLFSAVLFGGNLCFRERAGARPPKTNRTTSARCTLKRYVEVGTLRMGQYGHEMERGRGARLTTLRGVVRKFGIEFSWDDGGDL